MGTTTEPLKAEWQLFVDEYLIDLNATKAAQRAGFGSTEKSCCVTGLRLLGKASIRRAIRKSFKKRLERIRMTSDQVLKELAIIGLSDVQDYEVNDKTGRLVTLKGKSSSRAIQSVKIKKTMVGDGVMEVTTEYKLWDKMKALEMMMKHMGMVDDKSDDKQLSTDERNRRIAEVAQRLMDRRRSSLN